jgi:CRP-like cAMP-binding protein
MCALKEVNFSKEESILLQGATVDGLYYLSRGKVKLFCQLKGREHELASIQVKLF